jgi:hypothetical protein
MSVRYEADVPDVGSSSRAEVGLHPTDDRLREHRFKLAHRPSSGPAVWRRDTREYTESQAVLLCDFEDETGK